MDSSDTTTTTTTNTTTTTTTSYSPTSSPPNVILSPCAACKILRRRCVEKCVLAPYFPPTEPLKFTNAHRVFGASNIIKLLQELPESQRADAVSSMVYEANARIRDPVYGCAGAICQLQKQVNELEVQLARARADLTNMQTQQANLVTIICMEMAQFQQQCSPQPLNDAVAGPHAAFSNDAAFFLDVDGGQGSSIWEEPLWT